MIYKVFISGRVSGIKYENAKKAFAKREKKLRRVYGEVVNPIKLCKKDWSWARCMVVCLWNLIKCDTVYFMRNHKKSKGCKVELFVARLFNKCIYIEK